MKRALLVMTAALVILSSGSGCFWRNQLVPGNSAGGEACASCTDNAGPQYGGPPTAAQAYPYYTTRAPRDFLMDNPPSIGR